MKTIKLNSKEVKLLNEFLSLDLDNIGFASKDQKILNSIRDKLNDSKK